MKPPVNLTRMSPGGAERQRGGTRLFSNAEEPGSSTCRSAGGGRRAAGAAAAGTPRGGDAARPRRVESDRPAGLEAETVQDFSPVRCGQHGVLVGSMTQEYQADPDTDQFLLTLV